MVEYFEFNSKCGTHCPSFINSSKSPNLNDDGYIAAKATNRDRQPFLGLEYKYKVKFQ